MQMRAPVRMVVLLWAIITPAFAAPVITVISPQNGWAVHSPIYFAASATSPSCSKGVAAMRIYAAPHVAVLSIDAAQLETFVNLRPGVYDTVIQAWDNCGEVTKTAMKVSVSNTAGVTVYSPPNHTVAPSPMRFVASAGSPDCAGGISGMRIYTAPGVEAYAGSGNHLDAKLSLAPANYNTVVAASDNCGHVFSVPIAATIKSPAAEPPASTPLPAKSSAAPAR